MFFFFRKVCYHSNSIDFLMHFENRHSDQNYSEMRKKKFTSWEKKVDVLSSWSCAFFRLFRHLLLAIVILWYLLRILYCTFHQRGKNIKFYVEKRFRVVNVSYSRRAVCRLMSSYGICTLNEKFQNSHSDAINTFKRNAKNFLSDIND